MGKTRLRVGPSAPRGETVAYPTSPYRGRPPILTPALVVDAVTLSRGRVLLIRRGRPPWKGRWALPGGFVEIGETCEEAVRRELLEETGIRARVRGLLGVYSDPHRDPRAHLVSVAYRMTPLGREARGGDDAREARWWPISEVPRLASDHNRMLADALRRRR